MTNFNVSVSSIKTFLDCPEKWYHIYVLKHKKPSSYSEKIGDRVHYFIEHGEITGTPLTPLEEVEAIRIFKSIDGEALAFGKEAIKEQWFKTQLNYKNFFSTFMAKIDAYKYYPETKTIKVTANLKQMEIQMTCIKVNSKDYYLKLLSLSNTK